MAAALVLPGQPLHTPSQTSAPTPEAGPGVFARAGGLYASRVGYVVRDGARLSVRPTQSSSEASALVAVPDINATIIGTVTRVSRLQATVNIQVVDGRLCANDFVGVIRTQDVRQTDRDKVKIVSCFRPGDLVRATILSLGDVRSYYLSTARNDLGVIRATASDGRPLTAVDWETMTTEAGETEPRKVAGPSAPL